MTKVEKMVDRLTHGPVLPDGTRPRGYKLRNFNAWWGPNDGTAEQRAAAVNRILAQHDAGELTPMPGLPEAFDPPASAP